MLLKTSLSDSSVRQQSRAMSDDTPGLASTHGPMHEAILLMGPTGTGKSSLITRTTDEFAPAGHSLDSCTKQCQAYSYSHGGRSVLLIDTPGFADSTEDDMTILGRIVNFLKDNPSTSITGILFFFNIREKRIGGSTLLNIKILEGISGESFHPHIGLVSTMWDTLQKDRLAESERRFEGFSVMDIFSKPMGPIRQTFRFLGDQDSGRKILETFRLSPPDVAPRLINELRNGVLTEETTAAIPIKQNREKRLKDFEEEWQIDLRPTGSQVPEQDHWNGGQGGQPWAQRYGPVLVPFLFGIAAWALYPFVVSRPSHTGGN